MEPFAIMWPVFALVALIFAVWVSVPVTRLAYMRRQPPREDVFRTGDEMRRYFAPVELANDNLVNLLQMPVLFLVLAILLMDTHHADHLQVALAWLFVALRAAHTILHVRVRNVRARFRVHVASNAVLAAMWIGFFVDMVSAAIRYHHAVAALGLQP